jgi:hypothetical protein
VGRTLRTPSRDAPNSILRIEGDEVIVGTSDTPEGTPVKVAWVQEAMDRLDSSGELEVTTDALGDSIGHRSSFLGAVLRELDGAEVLLNPPRIRLRSGEQPAAWSVRPGESIKRTELHASFGGGGQGGIAPSARTRTC